MKKETCKKCNDKGWYFVNEFIGPLQGRKDCSCKLKPKTINQNG